MYAKHALNPNSFDKLEQREVLSIGAMSPLQVAITMRAALAKVPTPVVTHAVATPTPTPVAKPAASPGPTITMPKLSQDLNQLYQAFQSNGGNMSALASEFPMLRFQGSMVSVNVNGSGNFSTFEGQLTSLGMSISNASAPYKLVTGFVPIAELPTLSGLPQALSVSPNYKALLR